MKSSKNLIMMRLGSGKGEARNGKARRCKLQIEFLNEIVFEMLFWGESMRVGAGGYEVVRFYGAESNF